MRKTERTSETPIMENAENVQNSTVHYIPCNGGNASPPETGRSKKTIDSYAMRANLLLQKMQHETGCGESPGPSEIAKWFAGSECVRLGKSSVRVYRAALMAHMESIGMTDAGGQYDQGEIAGAIEILRSGKPGKKSDMTSSGRAKSIQASDILRFTRRLELRPGYSGRLASTIFQATVKTGLRPVEWFDATFDPYVPPESIPDTLDGQAEQTGEQNTVGDFSCGGVLTVRNAKATNGRANGQTRSLWVPPGIASQLVQDAIAGVRVAMDEGRSAQTIQRALQKVVGTAEFKNRHGRPIAMYTARHQFAANSKVTHTLSEVANMMGHASEETCVSNYGRRVSAHASVKAMGSDRSADDMMMPGDGMDDKTQTHGNL